MAAAPPEHPRLQVLAAVLLCAALALLCGLAPLAREGDGRLLDQAFRLHQRLGPRPAAGPEVVVVGLDEASARAIPEPLALYHRPLGRFLEAMALARPAAVGLDVVLPEHSYDDFVLGLDSALARGILRAKAATHLVLGMTVGDGGAPRKVLPLFVSVAGPGAFAFVEVAPDPDRVVRRYDDRMGLRGQSVPTLAGELARPFAPPPQPGLIHYALGRPFHYLPLGVVLDWQEHGRLQELQAAFAGKIVLLGSVIPFEDRVRLPVRLADWEAPASQDSPGVLLQAQILRTLLAGAEIHTLPDLDLVLLAALGALLGLAAARRPALGGPLLALLLAAAAVGAYQLLDHGQHLPLAGLGSAAVLAFGTRLLADLLRDRARKRAMEKELVWARLVEAKNAELEDANQRLQQAQDRIQELMDTRGNLLEDLPTWAAITGAEIQRTVGAEELGVFELRHGQVQPLKELEGRPTPDSAELKTALETGQPLRGALVVPALGLSGETLGALWVEGEFPPGSPERQLLQGFAAQLGGALEMVQVRQKLTAAEGVRGQSLEELHARGIATALICPLCGACYPHTESVCAKDGIALELPGILPLDVLGRYRLRCRLGEGGMGTVFEAEDLTLQRPVAVKLMRADLFRDPRSRLRFERETRTLVQAQHPHVVMVYDSGQLEDGSACLVMERLYGLDLADVLAGYGPGTPRQVARMLLQAAEALDAAHKVRIVHRDVKPQNLFLVPSAEGFEVKILDFGLAKLQDNEAKVTQTGFLMGTPAYMAPEQVLGRDADERSDLFSFATVVYEALLGEAPLPRGETEEILKAVVFTPPTLPSTRSARLGPEVDSAFLQAMAKDPDIRPASLLTWARGLAHLLEAVASPEVGWSWAFPTEPKPGEDGPGPNRDVPTAALRMPPEQR